VRVATVAVSIGVAGAIAGAVVLGGACAPRARMCTSVDECGRGVSCVAGRCLPDGGIPAIQNARRVVAAPESIAYLLRGDGAKEGAAPSFLTMGRDDRSDAVLLLRFNVPLPPDAKVIEAYVVLERTDLVDVDPTPIALHAVRIVEPWDARSVSWALQPKVQEVRAPTTQASPTGRSLVRIDVRELVRGWAAHEKTDQGIAIVSENTSPTGIAFALLPLGDPAAPAVEPAVAPVFGGRGALVDPRGSGLEALKSGPQRAGPRLELYVK